MRAYTKGAQIAIEAAGVIEKAVYYRYDLPMEYTRLGKMQYAMGQAGYVTEDILYADNATMKMLIRYDQDEKFLKTVMEASDGRIVPQRRQAIWAAPLQGHYEFFEEATV